MTQLHQRIPDAFVGLGKDVVDWLQGILDAQHHGVPTGGRIDWYRTTPPEGYLKLTGQTLPLPAYQALANAGQSDITVVTGVSITLPSIANKVIKY
jgi:hypothetical protein